MLIWLICMTTASLSILHTQINCGALNDIHSEIYAIFDESSLIFFFSLNSTKNRLITSFIRLFFFSIESLWREIKQHEFYLHIWYSTTHCCVSSQNAIVFFFRANVDFYLVTFRVDFVHTERVCIYILSWKDARHKQKAQEFYVW